MDKLFLTNTERKYIFDENSLLVHEDMTARLFIFLRINEE